MELNIKHKHQTIILINQQLFLHWNDENFLRVAWEILWFWMEYSDIDDDNNDIKMNRHLWLEEIRVIIVEMEK